MIYAVVALTNSALAANNAEISTSNLNGGGAAFEGARHLVAHRHVAVLHEVAREGDLLQRVLGLGVVVLDVHVRLEVADVERLAPGGLQVVEGGAATVQVGGGDLGVVGGERGDGKGDNSVDHCDAREEVVRKASGFC